MPGKIMVIFIHEYSAQCPQFGSIENLSNGFISMEKSYTRNQVDPTYTPYEFFLT